MMFSYITGVAYRSLEQVECGTNRVWAEGGRTVRQALHLALNL